MMRKATIRRKKRRNEKVHGSEMRREKGSNEYRERQQRVRKAATSEKGSHEERKRQQ